MARPSGVRTLAGYTLGDRLAQDIYGEVYRASEGKKQVCLLVVDPRLAGDEHFTEALSLGTASLLEALQHRAVVGTVVVAQDGKSLVVVTEGVNGATSLADLLGRVRSRGGKVPPRVAATIARAVVDALAAAHIAGIAHGALHPRSVLIDGDGYTRITDFAVGYAAMTAASQGSEALPLKGLAGYLAPELALGDTPAPASDVFACGALIFTMLTGETPPGSLNTTPAVERLVQRALDTDLARRFGDAIELQENFVEALEDDRWESAPPAEVARFVAEQVPADNLDAATEDLLASLGGAVEVTRQPGNGRGSGSVSSIPGSDPVTSESAGPAARGHGPGPRRPRPPWQRGGARLDPVRARGLQRRRTVDHGRRAPRPGVARSDLRADRARGREPAHQHRRSRRHAAAGAAARRAGDVHAPGHRGAAGAAAGRAGAAAVAAGREDAAQGASPRRRRRRRSTRAASTRRPCRRRPAASRDEVRPPRRGGRALRGPQRSAAARSGPGSPCSSSSSAAW